MSLPIVLPTPTSTEQSHLFQRRGQEEPGRFTFLSKSIAYQVLNAPAYLYHPSRRISNRDIMPDNILLTKAGCCELIDFGVAYQPPSFTPLPTLFPEKDLRSLRDIPIQFLRLRQVSHCTVTQNDTCQQRSLDPGKTGSAHYCGGGVPFVFAFGRDDCKCGDVARASGSPRRWMFSPSDSMDAPNGNTEGLSNY